MDMNIYIYMRVEQKVLNRGLHCEGPGVCNYQSRLKFCLEMAKELFLLAKDLAKVYVYVICIYIYIVSANVQKHVYQEGRPWQPQTHDFCIFCSSHDIRALGIL